MDQTTSNNVLPVLQDLLNTIRQLDDKVDSLRNDVAILKDHKDNYHRALPTLIASLIPQERREPPTTRGFPRFSELPREIRDMIWGFAVTIPRIASAKAVHRYCLHDRSGVGPWYQDALMPAAPTSSLLRVNSESRNHVRSTLVACLDFGDTNNILPILYINPKIDTLWITNFDPCRQYLMSQGYNWRQDVEIARVAIPFSSSLGFISDELMMEDRYREKSGFALEVLSRGVSEFIIITRGEEFARNHDIIFIEPRDYLDDATPGSRFTWQVASRESGSPPEGTHCWTTLAGTTEIGFKNSLEDAMEARQITKESIFSADYLSGVNKKGERDTLVAYAKGLWKIPKVTFMEATTRRELARW